MNYNKKYEEAIIKMLTTEKFKSTYLFYAHTISQCVFHVDNDVPTLGIRFTNNKYHLHINPDYFDSLPVNKAMGVLKHEALHILYKHTVRTPEVDYNHKAWNYATDISINQHIVSNDLPEGGLTYSMYNFPDDLAAEQYYFLLKEKHEEEQEEQEDSESGEGESQSGSGDQDNDSDEQDNEQQGQGSGTFKDGTPDPFQGDEDGNGFDEHDWDSAKEVDEELLNDVTSSMIEKSISKSKGYTPSQLEQFLKLFSNKAVVNWKQVLRKYTGNKRANTRQTIKKRNRRFPGRPEVKGKTKDYTYEVAVLADVSGSVSDEELYKGLSEVQEICRLTNSDLTLVQVDTVAYKPEKFSAKQTTWKRVANGGTTLFPGVEKLKECKVNYDALIVITDNGVWGDDVDNFNSHKKPTIWLSTQDGELNFDSHIRQFYIGE